jgi:RNA polymerase sigma factor (sigma-70 family)
MPELGVSLEAIEENYRLHYRNLVVYATRKMIPFRCLIPDMAQDVVQSVFASIVERREVVVIESNRHWKNYLFTAVKFSIINEQEKLARRHIESLAEAEKTQPLASPLPPTDKLAEDRELARLIDVMVAKLAPQQRRVWRERSAGKTEADTARVMGQEATRVACQRVASTYNKANENLRKSFRLMAGSGT